MSGTCQLTHGFRCQSGLPGNNYWQYVREIDRASLVPKAPVVDIPGGGDVLASPAAFASMGHTPTASPDRKRARSDALGDEEPVSLGVVDVDSEDPPVPEPSPQLDDANDTLVADGPHWEQDEFSDPFHHGEHEPDEPVGGSPDARGAGIISQPPRFDNMWQDLQQRKTERRLTVLDGGAGVAVAEAAPTTVKGVVAHVHKEIDVKFGSVRDMSWKVAAVTMYLCEENITGYAPSNKHVLTIMMIIDGEHWRAHHKQSFHYEPVGAWVESDRVAVDMWDTLTAVEGVFIKLGQQHDQIGWNWASTLLALQDVFNKLVGGTAGMKALAIHAKGQSDHVRKGTSNKVWKANWQSRVADMVTRIRNSSDRGGGMSDSMMKLFLRHWDTPKPERTAWRSLAAIWAMVGWISRSPQPTIVTCRSVTRYTCPKNCWTTTRLTSTTGVGSLTPS